MLLEAGILGLIIGRLRGGRLRNIGAQPLRLLGLVVLAFLIKWLLGFALGRELHWISAYTRPLHIFSYLLLIAFLFFNRNLPGMRIITLGVLLNFAVIAANGAMMPVKPEVLSPEVRELLAQGQNATHTLITASTRWPSLADILKVPGKLLSIGDLLMALGMVMFLQQAMQFRRRYKLTSVRY